MTQDQFDSIPWPDTFVIKCVDGKSVVLNRGDGISYMPKSDDPEGRGMLCGTMPPARSGQRRSYGICLYLDEIIFIEGLTGICIWPRDLNH